jgi:hypothetical protein
MHGGQAKSDYASNSLHFPYRLLFWTESIANGD